MWDALYMAKVCTGFILQGLANTNSIVAYFRNLVTFPKLMRKCSDEFSIKLADDGFDLQIHDDTLEICLKFCKAKYSMN